MWLSEGRLRRSSERHICAEKLFAKVRKSHFLGFFHWWIAVFADYRQLVLLRQIKGSTPVTSSSTTVLLPQRLFSSVFTSRFFSLSFCLAPCFLPLTPAFKAVVFFFDLLAGIISVRRAFSAKQLLCLQISKWNILICPPARWQWWIWGGLPAMRVFTWLWSEQICC